MNEAIRNLPSKPERVPDNVLISNIPPILEGGIVAVTRENLVGLVEAPLLEACEALYDMNIETVASSANAKNVKGEGFIAIVFDSLSDENKEVALQFGQPYMMSGSKPKQCVNISFPIGTDTTVGDVRRVAKEAVSRFHKQKMTWAQRDTLDDLARLYGIPVEGLSPEESFPDKYHDPETGYLYDSEEHYRKVKGTE